MRVHVVRPLPMLELLVLVALVLLGEFIPSDDDDVDNRVYVTLVLVLLVVVALAMMARLFVCLCARHSYLL